jgi:hypothetical protein
VPPEKEIYRMLMFPRKGMLPGELLLLDSGGFPVTRGLLLPRKGGIPGVLFPPTLGVPQGTLFPPGKGVPQGTLLPLGKGFTREGISRLISTNSTIPIPSKWEASTRCALASWWVARREDKTTPWISRINFSYVGL